MDIKSICSIIEQRQDELFELLSSLIKINSESFGSYGNEEECARYIKSLCDGLGLETDMYSPLDLPGFADNEDYFPGRGLENRYNVVARYRGEENVDELMLMAHSDTVMIGDRANWSFDPLSGRIADGKIYGRGAGDDKYAIATVLFIMKLLREYGYVPNKNIVFAAYSDEEYGGSHGAMAAVMKYPTNRIVSMDGREGQIWNCGSGGGELKYHFHSAGVVDSAKSVALALPVVIDVINEFAEARFTELDNNRFYHGSAIPTTSLRYMGVRAGNNGMDLDRGEVYFVFYTDKTKEEIYRELDVIDAKIKERLLPLGMIGDGFSAPTRFFHYVFCEQDSEDVLLMREASREATGDDLDVVGSCLSDLSVISYHGNSRAFGFGAGRDFSMVGGAHQPNEFIECDKLVNYAKTIATYIIKVLGEG